MTVFAGPYARLYATAHPSGAYSGTGSSIASKNSIKRSWAFSSIGTLKKASLAWAFKGYPLQCGTREAA
jgi:hypothetical protein